MPCGLHGSSVGDFQEMAAPHAHMQLLAGLVPVVLSAVSEIKKC